jgi:hypothetical protein
VKQSLPFLAGAIVGLGFSKGFMRCGLAGLANLMGIVSSVKIPLAFIAKYVIIRLSYTKDEGTRAGGAMGRRAAYA